MNKNYLLIGSLAVVIGFSFCNEPGTTTDASTDLFQYLNPGYGIGLRVMMNKTSRTNITIDYAWGNYSSQGLFLSVNETF